MQISSNPNIQSGKATEASNDLLQALASQNAKGGENAIEASQFAELLSAEVSQDSDEVAPENMEQVGSEGKTAEGREEKVLQNVIPFKQANLATVMASQTPGNNSTVKANVVEQDPALAKQVPGLINPLQVQVTEEKPVKSIFISPERLQEIELAKKNHIPKVEEGGRKSIFELPQLDAQSAKNVKTTNQVNMAQFQSSDDILNLRDFMQNRQTAQNALGEQVYKNQAPASMIQAKDLPNIARPNEGLSGLNSNVDALGLSLGSEVSQVDRHLAMQMGNQGLGGNELGESKQVFELGKLNPNTESSQILDQIKNYLIQSKVHSNPRVEMSFKHRDLGTVDLLVKKTEGDQISITIGTSTVQAAKFFGQNQADLLSTLSHAGIKVSDFKLDSSNNFSSSSNGNFAQNGRGEGHHTPQDQRRQDSERRQQLWEHMYNKEAA